MAALNTLTQDQKQLLANSLAAVSKMVANNIQRQPVNYQADTSAQLAATKALLDAAQG